MAKHIVAALNEIPPGGRKIVNVAGRSIGIFNIEGEFYALLNRCPHQGGPLCAGQVWEAVEAPVPGVYEYAGTGPLLRCPWHGWEFDVRTGQSQFDPGKQRVRRYSVTIEAAPSTPAEGPYLAETYPVTLGQGVLIIEL